MHEHLSLICSAVDNFLNRLCDTTSSFFEPESIENVLRQLSDILSVNVHTDPLISFLRLLGERMPAIINTIDRSSSVSLDYQMSSAMNQLRQELLDSREMTEPQFDAISTRIFNLLPTLSTFLDSPEGQ